MAIVLYLPAEKYYANLPYFIIYLSIHLSTY